MAGWLFVYALVGIGVAAFLLSRKRGPSRATGAGAVAEPDDPGQAIPPSGPSVGGMIDDDDSGAALSDSEVEADDLPAGEPINVVQLRAAGDAYDDPYVKKPLAYQAPKPGTDPIFKGTGWGGAGDKGAV